MAYVESVICGHMVPTDIATERSRLTFVRQTSIRTYGSARFTQRAITVASTGLFRMDIPNEIIKDLIIEEIGTTVTLVLTEPPRFYKPLGSDSKTCTNWSRWSSCPGWPQHERYSGQCLVYQLKIGNPNFSVWVKSLKEQDIISITRDFLNVMYDPEPYVCDYTTSMSAFESRIHNLKSRGTNINFPMLFQVQALVMNNYLPPASGSQMLEVMETVVNSSKEKGLPLPFTVDSMKRLFQQIPYPFPGVLAEEFDPVLLVQKMIKIE